MAIDEITMSSARWSEGTWSAAITPRGVMFLPDRVPSELVERIWECLRSPEGSLTTVLDEFVMGMGGRLGGIPEFVLVMPVSSQEIRIAVRGRVVLEVNGTPVRAQEVATWFETAAPASSHIVLSPPSQADDAPVLRPAADAVVPAGRVVIGEGPSRPAPVPAPRHETASTPEVSAPFELEEPTTYPVVPFHGDESSPTAEITAIDDEYLASLEDEDEDEERPGDHDGRTVAELPEDLVAELLPAVSASSPARHAETAPEQRVLSSVCANGHANPTSYTTCRQCGLPLNTPARYRPRPSLGWAVSSSGQRVELVRPVLIGRLPSPENVTTMTGLTAQPLTVDSPELLISRNHLLLDVDEWSVLAQDLSHSNGTILHREGSSPLRLSAGQSVVLRSNDLLDLGDGQTVRLQDLP